MPFSLVELTEKHQNSLLCQGSLATLVGLCLSNPLTCLPPYRPSLPSPPPLSPPLCIDGENKGIKKVFKDKIIESPCLQQKNFVPCRV